VRWLASEGTTTPPAAPARARVGRKMNLRAFRENSAKLGRARRRSASLPAASLPGRLLTPTTLISNPPQTHPITLSNYGPHQGRRLVRLFDRLRSKLKERFLLTLPPSCSLCSRPGLPSLSPFVLLAELIWSYHRARRHLVADRPPICLAVHRERSSPSSSPRTSPSPTPPFVSPPQRACFLPAGR
jgi:hypothetical protein